MQRLFGLRVLSLAGALLLTAAAHARLDTRSATDAGVLQVPTPSYAKLLALGFEPVLADYYWVQGLQLVGGSQGPLGARAHTVGDLIDVVTTLDPWVDHPYRFAALWLNDNPEQVARGNGLLRRGIERHPGEWRNRFYLGFNQFFYQGRNAAAAETLEAAIDLPGAPPYLGALVARLRAEGGDLEVATAFLAERLETSHDEGLRARYRASLAEIETERRARWLDSARDLFRERHDRDIHDPQELWTGALRVVDPAPAAHPENAEASWELDEQTGEIVSSHYGKRYRLHVHAQDAARQREWLETTQLRKEGGA